MGPRIFLWRKDKYFFYFANAKGGPPGHLARILASPQYAEPALYAESVRSEN